MNITKYASARDAAYAAHVQGTISAEAYATIEQALTAHEAQNSPLSTTDAAYKERNQVVAALAKCFPSGVKKTVIEGWDEAWYNCVYIDLPTGQASWHFHDRDAHLFDGLPPYEGEWDGHTTPEKYDRLHALRHAITA